LPDGLSGFRPCSPEYQNVHQALLDQRPVEYCRTRGFVGAALERNSLLFVDFEGVLDIGVEVRQLLLVERSFADLEERLYVFNFAKSCFASMLPYYCRIIKEVTAIWQP